MLTDTEIRKDLIRGWRDDAMELWRQEFEDPPAPGFDEEEDPDEFDFWFCRKARTRMEIAASSMDLDLAREITDLCDRTTVEAAIHDRAGDFGEIHGMFERAVLIDDPQIKGPLIAGLCFGINTPAWVLDLGLLSQALQIPTELEYKSAAIAKLVRTLGRPGLVLWVQPGFSTQVVADIAESTRDPEICRDALERSLTESNSPLVCQSLQAIAKSGDLALNEWAMRKLMNRESADERAFGLAALSNGPVGDWAFEFALSNCDLIGHTDFPRMTGRIAEVFPNLFQIFERAREFALAELAIARLDPEVTARMIDDEIRYLTLALIGAKEGDIEPARRLTNPGHRARALIEFARVHQDEASIFEANHHLKNAERDETHLNTLIRLLAVFVNLRPQMDRGTELKPKPTSPSHRQRRIHPDQLSLPLEI